MSILGISAGSHDAAITLVRNNGDIVFAAHAERYSKIKHDANLNSAMFGDMIEHGYPDRIAYYERPWLKKTRQLYAGQYSEAFKWHSLSNMLYEAAPWSNLDILPSKNYGHHLSHAAAGFQTSPFDEAAVVVIDAIGEWDTISIWKAYYDKKGNAQYKKLWSQKYPHSIGLMYSAFTKAAGLIPQEEEYILMGMVALAKPFRTYLNARRIQEKIISDSYNMIFSHNMHIGLPDELVLGEPIELAYTAQEIAEDLIETIMQRASEITKSPNVVYAGGVALNCRANRLVGNHFSNIWIMPNPGDAGSSLGAAALAHGGKLNWTTAYLGHEIQGDYPVKDLLSELVENQIVGVASGRAEFGPRALGNRSLLADPRGASIKDRVNEIKHRQEFRPFAPVILEEFVHDYFVMPPNWDNSPYMQTTARCKYPKEYPGVVHVDNTSRVQTVPKDGSGIRKLLEQWYMWSDCPMLLNTSLNVRGEPMVNDRNDAERFERLYGVKVCS
jgi:carbamoyltransferase